ncbi:MAG: hypothetical protein WBX03_19105, partial [Terriglobales bacterium]
TLFRHMAEIGGPAAATAWLRPFLGVIALIIAGKAALGFATGWGLLQARTLGPHADHRACVSGSV